MHLEFYLLIIPSLYNLKLNTRNVFKKKKKTTKNSFVNEPDLLKSFPPDPESPEVNNGRKNRCSQNRFQEYIFVKVFSLLSLDTRHMTATSDARKDTDGWTTWAQNKSNSSLLGVS